MLRGRGTARTRAPRGRGTRSSGRAAATSPPAARAGSCGPARRSAGRPRGTPPRRACRLRSTRCRSPSPSSCTRPKRLSSSSANPAGVEIANPGGRRLRVELDRREVEGDLGLHARQPRAGVAVDRHERVDAEGQRQPVAPLAGLELRPSVPRTGLDQQAVAGVGDGQREGKVERSLAAERLPGRPRDLRGLPARVGLEPHDLDGEVVALVRREERIGRVVGRAADAARQVRHAQAREHPARVEGLRRKRDRHPHDRGGARTRLRPEDGPAPVVAHARPRVRQPRARGQEGADPGPRGEQRPGGRTRSAGFEAKSHSAGSRNRSAPAAANTAGFLRPKRKGTVISSATAKVGIRLEGSRFRKSKISWPPGSSPVENVAQDTGVCAGMVGVSGE